MHNLNLKPLLTSHRLETFVKGYYRAAKCHLVMGSITNAANYLQKVIEKDPKNKDAQNDVSNIT